MKISLDACSGRPPLAGIKRRAKVSPLPSEAGLENVAYGVTGPLSDALSTRGLEQGSRDRRRLSWRAVRFPRCRRRTPGRVGRVARACVRLAHGGRDGDAFVFFGVRARSGEAVRTRPSRVVGSRGSCA